MWPNRRTNGTLNAGYSYTAILHMLEDWSEVSSKNGFRQIAGRFHLFSQSDHPLAKIFGNQLLHADDFHRPSGTPALHQRD
jgi:hypothetical protein